MNGPGDLITIREAATRAERHPSTIKRWIKAKRLTTHRNGNGRTASIMVEARELMTLLTDQAPRPRMVEARPEHEPSAAIQASLDATRADHEREISALALQIADLRADKARLQRELDDSRQRVAALEREMNGGVRGLLRAVWSR